LICTEVIYPSFKTHHIRRIVLCTAILFAFVLPAFGQEPPTALPGISLVWSRSVGGLKSFALSAHARRLALLTDDGKLALWTAQQGDPVWAATGQTGSRVDVSDGLGYVLSYSPRSLLKSDIELRRADTGAVIWSDTFSSSIWSAAFNLSGNDLAIGTGDNNIRVIALSNADSVTKLSVSGTPVSLAFDPAATKLYVGLWDQGGVSCYDFSGKELWSTNGEIDRDYKICSVGAKFITYIGASIRHGTSPVAYIVRTETGTLLWAFSLPENDRDAFAESSDAAELTAMSYAEPQPISNGSIVEQRLASFDRSGQLQWQKGGLFWAPTLICLTPDQDGIVVYDGERTLYRLDSQGRTVAKAFLSDVLKGWSASTDHSSLVVYTHDGQLSLLHIQ
jgi:WD40 repeat protein